SRRAARCWPPSTVRTPTTSGASTNSCALPRHAGDEARALLAAPPWQRRSGEAAVPAVPGGEPGSALGRVGVQRLDPDAGFELQRLLFRQPLLLVDRPPVVTHAGLREGTELARQLLGLYPGRPRVDHPVGQAERQCF